MEGRQVAFFTIEMSDTQIVTKVISDLASVPSLRITSGQMDDDETTRVISKIQEYAAGSMRINDRAGRSIELFEAECRRLHRQKKLDMVILDYVQQMRCYSERFNNKQAEISEISARLKNLAMQLDIPVLALAQVNRENAKGADKRPTMAQIKDSGALEQDADAIMFVHRGSYYDEQDEKDCIILAKNRYGAIGTFDVGVRLDLNRFVDIDA